MARSVLTEKFERLTRLADEISMLPDDERNFLLDQLLPEPAEQPTPKKRKARKGGKSPRAKSLAGAIGGTAKPTLDAVCGYAYKDGSVCGESWTSAIHDPAAGYAGYHEFQPAEQAQVASGD